MRRKDLNEAVGKVEADDPRRIRYGVRAAWPPPSPFPAWPDQRWKPATRNRFGMAATFRSWPG